MSYVVPQSTGGSITVSPRSFVVAELINQKFYFKVIGAIPSVSKLTVYLQPTGTSGRSISRYSFSSLFCSTSWRNAVASLPAMSADSGTVPLNLRLNLRRATSGKRCDEYVGSSR